MTWRNFVQWPFHCRSIAWACLCPNIRPWRPLPPDLGTFVGDSSGTEPVYGTSRRVGVGVSVATFGTLCFRTRIHRDPPRQAMPWLPWYSEKGGRRHWPRFSFRRRSGTLKTARFGFGVAMLGLRGWKVDKSDPSIGLMYVDVILRYNSGSMAH